MREGGEGFETVFVYFVDAHIEDATGVLAISAAAESIDETLRHAVRILIVGQASTRWDFKLWNLLFIFFKSLIYFLLGFIKNCLEFGIVLFF